MKKLLIVAGIVVVVAFILGANHVFGEVESPDDEWPFSDDGGEAVGPWDAPTLETFYGTTLAQQQDYQEYRAEGLRDRYGL